MVVRPNVRPAATRSGIIPTGGGRWLWRRRHRSPDEQAVVDLIVQLRSTGARYRELEAEGHHPHRAQAWSPIVMCRIVERAGAGTAKS